MVWGKRVSHKPSGQPKTLLDSLVQQAKATVLQMGIYQGSSAEWVAAAQRMADQAYFLSSTHPEEIIRRRLEGAKLRATIEGERVTVEGLAPFMPKPKPLVWIQRGLFDE